MQLRSVVGDFRILSMVLMISSMSSSTSSGRLLASLSLGQRPDSFIGVEFWGVGRKMLDRETWVFSKQFLEWLPLDGWRNYPAAQ